MIELMDKYFGEIMAGAGVSIILGVWGLIIGFFRNIKKMEEKIKALETRLDHNTRGDEDLKKWVNTLIENKLR